MGIESALVVSIITSAVAAAASTAASYVITKLTTPRPEPVRIGEADALEITTARYGEVIPRGHGDGCGMAGKWIYRAWKPYRLTQQSGGGKHNPGTIQYTFYVDCAVMLCLNPGGTQVKGIEWIKLDDKTIYPPRDVPDASGIIPAWVNGMPQSYPSPSLPIVDGSANRIRIGTPDTTGTIAAPGPCNSFEIRLGGQEQANIPVDWYMNSPGTDWQSSDQQTEHNYGVGANLGPSYTNRVTIWLKSLNLEDYGRRLPQVKALVRFADDTVADVVVAEAQLAGLNASDLDVTAFTSEPVAGMLIDGITSPTEVIGSLGIFKNFAMPLIDGKLKLISLNPIASPPALSLNDAGAMDGGLEDGNSPAPQLLTTISQATEMPQRVEISFIDAGRGHTTNSAGWGHQTTANKGLVRFNWPIVMTPDEAVAVSKRVLYVTRAERIQYQGELLPKYIQYHPGDEFNLTTPEGINTRIRLTQQSLAAGDKITFKAVRVIPTAYVQVGHGPTPLSDLPSAGLTGLMAPSDFWVGDVTTMLDAHQGQHGFYVAACPIRKTAPSREDGTAWSGATLWANFAGTDEAQPAYQRIVTLDVSATFGWLEDYFYFDDDEIRVLSRGTGIAEWRSMSDAQWNSGEVNNNVIIVGREVVQFRYAELLDVDIDDPPMWPERPPQTRKADLWRLYGLRRALRGTNTGDSKPPRTPCVLYDPKSVLFVPWNYSGFKLFNVRMISEGKSFQSGLPVAFRYDPELNEFHWAVSWELSERRQTLTDSWAPPATHDNVTVIVS